MKKISLFFVLLFSVQIVSAQFGISAAYKPIDAPNWEYIIAQHRSNEPSIYKISPLTQGIHFGLDYWFRLKNYRVEFLPELSLTRYTRIWEKEEINDQINSNFVGLHFNTNIYPFDLKGDCNCPTFSKQGTDLSKGFFIQISPGFNYVSNSYKTDQKITADDFAPSVGIGFGIDFGLSDFLTLTPMVKIHRYFGVEWEGLNEYFEVTPPIGEEYNTNDITQFFYGIRIGLRFDEFRR